MCKNRVSDRIPERKSPGVVLSDETDLRRMPVETAVGNVPGGGIGLFFYEEGLDSIFLDLQLASPYAGLVMTTQQARLISQALAFYCDKIEGQQERAWKPSEAERRTFEPYRRKPKPDGGRTSA